MGFNLRNDVIEQLAKIENARWFARMGEPLLPEEEYCVLAKNLKAACVASKKRIWDEVLLEMANVNNERIAVIYPGSFSGIVHPNHDDYVDEIQKLIRPLVESKCRTVINEYSLPQDTDASLRWIILGYLISIQYVDAIDNDHFMRLCQHIIAGRFPCGWSGSSIDDGKVIIY